MGMSASQARLLSLQARQSNLEYQGQQINQERTILSQQCTALYNSLLAMTVPTPPSTQDFTKVEYAGKNGTTTYSFTASDVKPGKDGGYNIKLGYTDYGNSLVRNNGYATTSQGYETVKGRLPTAADTKETTKDVQVNAWQVSNPEELADGQSFVKPATGQPEGQYYVMYNGQLVLGGNSDIDETGLQMYVRDDNPDNYDQATCFVIGDQTIATYSKTVPAKTSVKQEDLENLYIMNSVGTIEKAVTPRDYMIEANGSVVLTNTTNNYFIQGTGSDEAKKGTNSGYKIAGYAAMSMTEYKSRFGEKDMATYNGYCEAIKNSGLTDASGNPYTEKDFMVYIDSDGQPHFALETDVKDNDTCVTYDFVANGEYTKKQDFENAKLKFEPSTGRISSVDIPVYGADGEIVSWTTIEMEAKTVTDELAYQDAYNDYEYEQYLYDKKQQEINAKTEIIQQQDRNLELKLQRLDNERTQITTEIEALDKVIGDNIESSYKTFSG